jgi:hypothetical protein
MRCDTIFGVTNFLFFFCPLCLFAMSAKGVGVSLVVLIVSLKKRVGIWQSLEHAIVAGVVTVSFFRVKALGMSFRALPLTYRFEEGPRRCS